MWTCARESPLHTSPQRCGKSICTLRRNFNHGSCLLLLEDAYPEQSKKHLSMRVPRGKPPRPCRSPVFSLLQALWVSVVRYGQQWTPFSPVLSKTTGYLYRISGLRLNAVMAICPTADTFSLLLTLCTMGVAKSWCLLRCSYPYLSEPGAPWRSIDAKI